MSRPAAVVNSVSPSTSVKGQRSDERSTKWNQQLLFVPRSWYKGWVRESRWYRGLASSLPVSAPAASVGASRLFIEWKQKSLGVWERLGLRQKSGYRVSSLSFCWCFPPLYRMEVGSGETRAPSEVWVYVALASVRNWVRRLPALLWKSAWAFHLSERKSGLRQEFGSRTQRSGPSLTYPSTLLKIDAKLWQKFWRWAFKSG